ncbi:MAG: HD domain-containing protein [Gemmatimonadales bacterium]
MNIERWSELMRAFDFGVNEEMFNSLRVAYSEAHRHYHTGEHVQACLRHLDSCSAQTDEPKEIELALWFHDAIYKPLSSNNERMSADWAATFLLANSVNREIIARVHRLIMATEHNAPTNTKDESILVDIDLSILGATIEVYTAFEEAVRREYRIVPMFIYRRKRTKVLNSFLRRPRIYQNEPFRSEREQQARVNLSNAISQLSARA